MGIEWEFDPEKLKGQLSLDSLTPGVILHIYSDYVQKKKYLVLVCNIEDPHIFFINTQPTAFTRKRKDLMDCQIVLKKDEYDFLKHDSYLDCATLVKLSKEEIEQQVKSDYGCIKGVISATTKLKLINAVSKARPIPGKKKATILKDLNNRERS